ncbi:adhesion G-protein coupled receptor D1-like isoform X2 [Acropora palmata]|uniref:adhesion G-protein coupled receptor D1-like isoform X2 n=1 Tax=Acropora palmata TaxID=6131 RepID=UPI003DA1B55D
MAGLFQYSLFSFYAPHFSMGLQGDLRREMKALLRVFLVICFANFDVTTRAYKINKSQVTWEQAKELCQKSGSILAVVDSQDKIEELSNKLSFLGYKSAKHKFWIGLRTNTSIGQFVWSTGKIAQASFINSACGINSGHIKSGQERCYLFKNQDSPPSCFQQTQCSKTDYFICQSLSYAELLSNLSTSDNRITASSITSVESLTVTSKKSSISLTANIPGQRSTRSLAEESSATSQLTKPTSSKSTATSVVHFYPTASVSISLEAAITPDKRQNMRTSVTSHSKVSRTLNGQSSPSMTTYASSSISADAGVEDSEQLENPISAFINFVGSLNPKDNQALELLTDKFGDLVISLKANASKDIEDNVIESAQAIEDFAFKYAILNLNASKNQERKKNQDIVIQLSLLPKGHAQNFTFLEDNGAARITLPSYLFRNQDTIVFNALYMDLHEYVARSNPRKSIIGSRILGTSIKPSQRTVFEENVTIVLQTITENHQNAEQECAFWKWNHLHPENGAWSSEGCWLLNAQENFTVCTCNHLTNFAILMNTKKQKVPQKHKLPLSYITYVGLGLSLLGETITILAYLLLLWSKHNQQSHVHINLVTTLAMAQVFFLAGIKSTQDQDFCTTVAALIHYFYLSSFCWMLIEGVMLYLLIIEVYNVAVKLRYCYLSAYGFPGLVVTVTLLTAHVTEEDGIYQYRSREWCWLSGRKHYIWSFVAPVILVTGINVVVFCAVVKEMLSMTSVKSTRLNALKTTIKACVVLFPLLGITWLFGLLSLSQAGVVTQYLFTIFNSIQGLLIFLLHCARNSEVRSAWNEKLQFLKKRAWTLVGMQNSSPSNTNDVRSSRPERSEMELHRKFNKISPVEG